VVAGAGEHVVPLQQLVQDDPVDEPSEADAHENAAGVEAALFAFRVFRGRGAGARGHGFDPPCSRVPSPQTLDYMSE
jgi:hypothetical protein